MQPKPWIEQSDPLKDFYGLLDQNEIVSIYDIIKKVNISHATFYSANLCKDEILLLDFSDYYNKSYQFELLSKLIENFYHVDHFLYWLPLNSDVDISEYTFNQFVPLMIAKTPMEIKFLDKVSRSMMQMISGGYVVVDSQKNFIAIIIDGYYMLALINDKFSVKYEKYIKNWSFIEENLDPITAKSLITKNHNK